MHRLSITFDYLDSKLALKLLSESLESASRRADFEDWPDFLSTSSAL